MKVVLADCAGSSTRGSTRGIGAIEVKAGSTVNSDYFRSINRVADLIPEVRTKAVVYGGEESQSRSDCEVVPLSGLEGVLERFEG